MTPGQRAVALTVVLLLLGYYTYSKGMWNIPQVGARSDDASRYAFIGDLERLEKALGIEPEDDCQSLSGDEQFECYEERWAEVHKVVENCFRDDTCRKKLKVDCPRCETWYNRCDSWLAKRVEGHKHGGQSRCAPDCYNPCPDRPDCPDKSKEPDKPEPDKPRKPEPDKPNQPEPTSPPQPTNTVPVVPPTATSTTVVPTGQPSLTPRPSDTPYPTQPPNTVQPSLTPRPSDTPYPTETPLPTNTPTAGVCNPRFNPCVPATPTP